MSVYSVKQARTGYAVPHQLSKHPLVSILASVTEIIIHNRILVFCCPHLNDGFIKRPLYNLSRNDNAKYVVLALLTFWCSFATIFFRFSSSPLKTKWRLSLLRGRWRHVFCPRVSAVQSHCPKCMRNHAPLMSSSNDCIVGVTAEALVYRPPLPMQNERWVDLNMFSKFMLLMRTYFF